MPQFSRRQVLGLVKTFNMYVRFEEERWPEIEMAEAETPDGIARYEMLTAEFKERFWTDGESMSFEDASLAQ